ncbi:MAG: hypothetical protein ACMUJM_07830 [bacterium]
MEREKYHLCFRFEYGPLDDGTLWIRTPRKRLYHIDWLTLRLLLELNAGATVSYLVKKYKIGLKEVRSLLTSMEKEGAVVPLRQGKITRGRQIDDIHLSPYIFISLLLGLIQLYYFQNVARTFRLNRWYEGLLIALISALPIISHEMGHYMASRPYFPSRLGFTFLWIFPAVYIDTQEAWCLPQNIRLLINSSGLLMDLAFNSILIFLVAVYPRIEYYVTPLLILQYTRWSIILNPLVHGDGYWLLSDISKTVNLGQKGNKELRKGKINWISMYGLLSLIFSLFSFLGLAWFAINLLGKFIPSLFFR